MGILGEIERVISTGERSFQIAQEGIDRTKLLHLHTGRTAASNGTLVSRPRCRNGLKAPQAIGHNMRRCAQRFLRPFGHRLFGKLQLGEASVQRVTRFGRLHRSHEGNLVLGASPTLATRQLASQIGIVDFNATIKLPRLLTHTHYLHQLVLHQPRRLVANAYMALEFQRRYAVLRLTQQMHRQKPACERQFGSLEDRAADRGGLLPAHRTLPVFQPLALENAMGRFATIRTKQTH